MNRGRVGEERGGKETDGCPLTKGQLVAMSLLSSQTLSPGAKTGAGSC
jgi:hypothetical protein